MKARKRYLLRDKQQNKVATVITFFDTVLNCEVGFISTFDHAAHTSCIYPDNWDADIIADLASQIHITYHDYIEIPIKNQG